MTIWSMIAAKLKEILFKMIGSRTIEQTLHVAPVISSQMETAIELWSDMYKGEAPWIREPSFENPVRVVSLGLPSLIASEKARTALLEMNSEITTPTKEVTVKNPDYKGPEVDIFGNVLPSTQPETITKDTPTSSVARAEYLEEQYKKLKKQLRKQIEYGIAKGGLVIKPYVVVNRATDETDVKSTTAIEFDFIQADSFYPLAFDASGNITEAAFIQTKAEKDIVYRRLEYHKWDNNTVRIINKAFKSSANDENFGDRSGLDLGHEVPLSSVNEWKDLKDNTVIKNVPKPLFAYFKMPEANTIDTSSPLGVSGFSRAVNLIKDADMQYSRLLWEYEAGEMAIDVDRDALNFLGDGETGHSVLGSMQQRLYRKIDLGESDTYQPYSPPLRDTSFITGLNTILMRIEDVTGLSRGTISDAAAEARTATELKILKQRSYQTNADIQAAIEDALRDTIYIMNAYCDLYEITPDGDYDVNFEWDDSIIVDVDTELGKRMTLMENGIASKLEIRMWYYGETERQAQEALMRVEEESRQAMEQDMAQQQGMINAQMKAETEGKGAQQ